MSKEGASPATSFQRSMMWATDAILPWVEPEASFLYWERQRFRAATAAPCLGRGKPQGGRGTGKREAVKTTCLPFNNLEGCLEEAQQRSQQRERVGARAISPQQGVAGRKAAWWETQQVQGAKGQCAVQGQGHAPSSQPPLCPPFSTLHAGWDPAVAKLVGLSHRQQRWPVWLPCRWSKLTHFKGELSATWETAIGQGKINWKLTSVVKTQSLPEKIKFFLVLLKFSDLRTPWRKVLDTN